MSTLRKRRRARAYRYEKREMETGWKRDDTHRGNEKEGEPSLYGEKKQKNQRCLAGWLGCFSSPVLSLLLDFVRSSVRVGSCAAFIGSLQLASASVCMTKTGKRPSREAARLRRNAPTLVLRAKDDRNAAYWEDSEILRR